MSTIGNVLNSAKTKFEINSQAAGGDLFTTVSAVNNLWSEFNNSGSSPKEAIRSFILLVQDTYGLFVKSTNHNIANSLTKVANLANRLWVNIDDFNKITDPLNPRYDSGYVKKVSCFDISEIKRPTKVGLF
ncbi:hypothetical protein [Acinetobacter haemolyticus]|uniref:hypothetical protein n=1 Tax=Acinetobacter haemolyticus TaxID=29430 RepID=UPI000DEB28ED|nr:hypothetical protein [Acinetobacter haemolyticus]WHR59075.1 hypothetical protein PGW89_06495 [Acinetobacter haemolyticus]